MAVNKELYERYKKLKAEGVNITLAELKQQMEQENNSAVSGQSSGFKALSSQNTSSQTYCDNVSSQSSYYTQENSYNDSSYNQSYSEVSSFVQSENTQNNNSYFDNNSTPQVNSNPVNNENNTKNEWVTTYSEPQVDKNSQLYKNYSNSFNSNFTTGANSFTTNQNLPSQSFDSYSQSTTETSYQTSQKKYTGNITSEALELANSENKIMNKYCLIGYPLGHSLSKYIHNAGFKSLGIDATYDILETPPDTLVERIKYLKNNNFAGFNVTIPLKLPVTLFLDKIDSSADVVGAVNTVVINPDKTLVGYNTDVIGFRNAIPDDIILAGKVAAVLGTGGAARAAITALAQNQVKQIKLYTRNIPNCLELLNFLRDKFKNVEFNAFQIERIRDLSDVQILVNTTPIGMQGRAADMTPIEENELRTLPQGAIVYDVIYNPKKTILLKLAQKNGYRTINGVDMFIHQALAAQKIWTGRTPDFKDMKIAALENL